MSKMTVIQLLNKIANGIDIPLQIKYDNDIWKYDEMARDYLLIDKSGEEYLICEELNLMYALNEEVEIIEDKPFNERVEEIYNRHIDYIYNKEDKKIERLKNLFIIPDRTIENLIILADKINEIIDKINED